MSESIDYGNLMHQAMRDLIKQVLHGVQDNGLPGDHHFSSLSTQSIQKLRSPVGLQNGTQMK